MCSRKRKHKLKSHHKYITEAPLRRKILREDGLKSPPTWLDHLKQILKWVWRSKYLDHIILLEPELLFTELYFYFISTIYTKRQGGVLLKHKAKHNSTLKPKSYLLKDGIEEFFFNTSRFGGSKGETDISDLIMVTHPSNWLHFY